MPTPAETGTQVTLNMSMSDGTFRTVNFVVPNIPGPAGPPGEPGAPGSPYTHNHDDRYYTKAEIDVLLGNI